MTNSKYITIKQLDELLKRYDFDPLLHLIKNQNIDNTVNEELKLSLLKEQYYLNKLNELVSRLVYYGKHYDQKTLNNLINDAEDLLNEIKNKNNVILPLKDKFDRALLPPFRVGRKEKRSIVDINGLSVVIFYDHFENIALDFCEYLNNKYKK